MKFFTSAFAVTMAITLGGCSEKSQSTMATMSAAEAYSGVIKAYESFEVGAEKAAQGGGPVALAEFAIQNGGSLSAAVLLLNEALTTDPTNVEFPEPALLETVAKAGGAYGADLINLSTRLSACPTEDNVCYEAAYQVGEGEQSVNRDQFRTAVFAVNAVANQYGQGQ